MFRLKRKQQTKNNTVRKQKNGAQAFGNHSSSDEDVDPESKFLASVKKKSQKISLQVSEQDETRITALMESNDENADIIKNTDNRPKYMLDLIETNKRRKQEQMAMKYEAMDKKLKAKDVFVYESNEYKQEKDNALMSNNYGDEDDDVRDDVLFFNNIISSKLGEGSVVNESNLIGRTSNKIFNGENQTGKLGDKESHNFEVSHKDTTSENILHSTSSNRLLQDRIREYVKTKITTEQLEEYKSRYWERIKSNKRL